MVALKRYPDTKLESLRTTSRRCVCAEKRARRDLGLIGGCIGPHRLEQNGADIAN